MQYVSLLFYVPQFPRVLFLFFSSYFFLLRLLLCFLFSLLPRGWLMYDCLYVYMYVRPYVRMHLEKKITPLHPTRPLHPSPSPNFSMPTTRENQK